MLRAAFEKPSYKPQTIVIGANTDPYQPAERKLKLTRELLQTFLDYRHPVGLITKGGGILRDLDILAELARHKLVKVMISLTTLDNELKRKMEPRTASPAMRLHVMRELHACKVPVGTLIAPIIPFINDHEMEALVQAAANAGAHEAGCVVLRLPLELTEIFQDWLQTHYPQRAEKVMNSIRELRGGKTYDARFGQRMSGHGQYAQLLAQRFQLALRKAGLNARSGQTQRCDLFRVPGRPVQGELQL